jgi:hypothetical protein
VNVEDHVTCVVSNFGVRARGAVSEELQELRVVIFHGG